jgi:hypothetical protein
LQGKAQIGGHLAHCVVVAVLRQRQQVFLQSVGGFAFLEKPFRALNVSGDLGSVYSLGRVWHERWVTCGVTRLKV